MHKHTASNIIKPTKLFKNTSNVYLHYIDQSYQFYAVLEQHHEVYPFCEHLAILHLVQWGQFELQNDLAPIV